MSPAWPAGVRALAFGTVDCYLANMREKAAADENLVQLATRIPKQLHQAVKLHCVQTEQSMAEFVAAALREKLRRPAGR
jgi:predicted HicB family RNase H-like nuclease